MPLEMFYVIDYDCQGKTPVCFIICLVSTLVMQSIISISGYGFRKRTCEDVASWFMNEFFPRHKIYVEIVHRGLKRESVYGWCDVLGETYRPREFLIELNTYMEEELYIKTLLHELTHLRQWVMGSLRMRSGKIYYGQQCTEDYEYKYKAHEIEARQQEQILYARYMRGKRSVPDPKVVQFFPNRLCSAL